MTLKPDRPVDPAALLVMQEVDKASKALGYPVFLVGAMARIILLWIESRTCDHRC
jgi:hypothetical protein